MKRQIALPTLCYYINSAMYIQSLLDAFSFANIGALWIKAEKYARYYEIAINLRSYAIQFPRLKGPIILINPM